MSDGLENTFKKIIRGSPRLFSLCCVLCHQKRRWRERQSPSSL
jgi:hypothetical protein